MGGRKKGADTSSAHTAMHESRTEKEIFLGGREKKHRINQDLLLFKRSGGGVDAGEVVGVWGRKKKEGGGDTGRGSILRNLTKESSRGSNFVWTKSQTQETARRGRTDHFKRGRKEMIGRRGNRISGR